MAFVELAELGVLIEVSVHVLVHHEEAVHQGTRLENLPLAQAVELVRRVGASGDLYITGPPTAAGTVAQITKAYSAVNTTTGVITVYDEEGSVEEGVEVSVQIIVGPGTDGIGYDSAVWTESSDALGVVEFAGIILGARYKIWRGESKANAQTFTAPDSGDSFDLAEVIGRG